MGYLAGRAPRRESRARPPQDPTGWTVRAAQHARKGGFPRLWLALLKTAGKPGPAPPEFPMAETVGRALRRCRSRPSRKTVDYVRPAATLSARTRSNYLRRTET